DLVQVEIVGDDIAAQHLGEFHQPGIHFIRDAPVFELVVVGAYDERELLLHGVEDVQPAPAARSLERIAGIGDVLQLIEHKSRHVNRTFEETGAADVDDSAIDDHVGVEDLAMLHRHLRTIGADRRSGSADEPEFVLHAHHGADAQIDKGYAEKYGKWNAEDGRAQHQKQGAKRQ